jgi:hypothetical protein
MLCDKMRVTSDAPLRESVEAAFGDPVTMRVVTGS